MRTRRQILQELALAVPLLAAWKTAALASVGRAALDRWANDVVALNRALTAGDIGLLDWQDRIASLNTSVPVDDISRYLEIDTLTRHFTYPTRLAETIDPKFPKEVSVDGVARSWFMRVFAMREGGTIIPHAHNNMVSAHLVVHGSFHARTYDRIVDEERAIAIRPSLDRLLSPGEVITMSDDRDNIHWLVAQRSRSLTFDVGVVSISKTRTYRIPAENYSMVYLDPTQKPGQDGLIHAPVLSFDQSVSKFAASER
jgi:hypothetical protein